MIAYVISVLVGILVGASGMGFYVHSLPPKTTIENNYTTQNVESRNENIQRVDQSQTTIVLNVDGKYTNEFRYVSIVGNSKTNNTYTFMVKTNVLKKTN
jgi:hypothetical protein